MANRRQKGTGSIWQDKTTKKWKGQIQIGVLPSGKRKLKTVTGVSQKEVKWKLNEIQKNLLTDGVLTTSNDTIVKIANQINEDKYKLNVIKAVTYKRTNESIARIESYPTLADKPIAKVTGKDIRDFYNYLINENYSNSVLKKVYAQINLAYKKAIKENVVKANLNDDIPCPKSLKPTKKITALSVEQQKKFVEAITLDNKEPYKTMLLLSLYTGMRMGEICALNTSDIDFDSGIINIERTVTRDENDNLIVGHNAKTEAGHRQLKMLPNVTELLKDYINQNADKKGTLFTKKGLITPSQVNSYYKRLITRYKIADSFDNFNQHQLRHTYATRSIESGMSAKVLQKKLGHVDIKITMNTYADVFAKFEDTEDEKLANYLQENGLI